MSAAPGEQRIDWVVPPFAGHAYPALMVAAGLRKLGYTQLRVLSTPSLGPASAELGLPFTALMTDREADILAIANTKARGPRAMLQQFRATLALLEDLGVELSDLWAPAPPDLVIADSVLPSAGLSARRLGADWWTSMASLAPTETRTGTPAYLGGWMGSRSGPQRGLLALRDQAGRGATRLFKRLAAWLGRGALRRMGLPSLWREDGTEAFYSGERILGFGSKAFEFHRDWPAALSFVGPVFGSPLQGAPRPALRPGETPVLVSLGTHLGWAKSHALGLVRQIAQERPEWTLHFSLGDPRAETAVIEGNLHVHPYIPYDDLSDYRLALVHGGAGIVYACLAQGIPMVLWPHDYDQFDNAARVVACGAGRRAKGRLRSILPALDDVTASPSYREAAEAMSANLRGEDPIARTAALLASRRSS